MSITEAQRFVSDLAQKPDLLAEVKPFATGLAAVVALGKKHGYDFTIADAKQYIQSRSPQELTDRQLDAVVGGKNSHSSTATQTNVMEAAEAVSSAVTVTQAATATDVAAAAEVAVVIAAVLI